MPIPPHLVPIVVTELSVAALIFLAVIVLALAADGRSQLRHRPGDIAPTAEPEPEPAPEIEYDPLDHRIPLEEVERRMALCRVDDTRELEPIQ